MTPPDAFHFYCFVHGWTKSHGWTPGGKWQGKPCSVLHAAPCPYTPAQVNARDPSTGGNANVYKVRTFSPRLSSRVSPNLTCFPCLPLSSTAHVSRQPSSSSSTPFLTCDPPHTSPSSPLPTAAPTHTWGTRASGTSPSSPVLSSCLSAPSDASLSSPKSTSPPLTSSASPSHIHDEPATHFPHDGITTLMGPFPDFPPSPISPLFFLSLPLSQVLLTPSLSPSLPLSQCYPPYTMTLPSLFGPP
jgi:hypothetical protein